MNKPNFFIVGSAKSGTTSLHYYLKQHPQIYFSPVKEPNYFAKELNHNLFLKSYRRALLWNLQAYVQGDMAKEIHLAYFIKLKDYLSLFKKADGRKAIGEASTLYLYSPVAAKEIRKFNPNSKIIIILRNPVERAFSHYLMDLKDGVTNKSLSSLIKDFRRGKNNNWGESCNCIEFSFYYKQIKRYYNVFPKKQIKIIFLEDLQSKPNETIKDLLGFLNVDSNFKPNTNYKQNESKVFRSPFLKLIYNNLLIARVHTIIRPTGIVKQAIEKFFYSQRSLSLDQKDKLELLNLFRSDTIHLSKLLRRDLSNWLDT